MEVGEVVVVVVVVVVCVSEAPFALCSVLVVVLPAARLTSESVFTAEAAAE